MSKTRIKLLYLECSTTLGHVIDGSGGISLLADFQGSPTQKASPVWSGVDVNEAPRRRRLT